MACLYFGLATAPFSRMPSDGPRSGIFWVEGIKPHRHHISLSGLREAEITVPLWIEATSSCLARYCIHDSLSARRAHFWTLVSPMTSVMPSQPHHSLRSFLHLAQNRRRICATSRLMPSWPSSPMIHSWERTFHRTPMREYGNGTACSPATGRALSSRWV